MASQSRVSVSQFIDEIRAITGDDEELRASLKLYGWVPHLPALVDEDGEIIVGHRRTRLAKELGIPTVRKTIVFGENDEADAERLKLAIVSNIGGQPMSKNDRKRVAEYLYGKREWTMERIAEALNVAFITIQRDVRHLSIVDKCRADRGTDTLGRKKSTGRPKAEPSIPGPARARSSTKATKFNAAREIIRPRVEADQPLKTRELEEEHGISVDTLERAAAAERARKQAFEEMQVDPTMLSVSAQHKLEVAIRQHQRKLDSQFESRVLRDIKRRVDSLVMPSLREREQDAAMVQKARKGVFKPEEYKAILRCVHPDTQPTIEQKNEAFRLLHEKRMVLLSEKDDPSPKVYPSLPTVEEFMSGYDNWKTKAKGTN